MTPQKTTKSILILGATSGIGQAFARQAARRGYSLTLVGRSAVKLDQFVSELNNEFPDIIESTHILDIRKFDQSLEGLRTILKTHGEFDGAFLSVGVLYYWEEVRDNPQMGIEMMETNFVGHVVWLNELALYFSSLKKGFISCVSSFAGDVCYRQGLLYGPTKAGLDRYLEGLRHEYFKTGILVQTIKPGPVQTPMVRTPRWKPAIVSPEYTARKIWQGLNKRKSVVYVPPFWKMVGLIVNMIPEFIRHRVKL